MIKFKSLPPLERLHELLEVVEIPPEKYGKWSGLVWKVSRGRQRAGSVAGSPFPNLTNPKRDDWKVRVDYAHYMVSRVIYYIAYGVDPGDIQVDHRDQNWLNNNVYNLRLDIDGNIQRINRSKYCNNTSGLVGVSWDKEKGKWKAYVNDRGKRKNLGYFTCKVEAARVVRDKWIELGWHELGRKLPDLDEVQCDCGACKR